MIVSNLRIENKNQRSYLIADVECGFSDEKELWFSLDCNERHMFSDDVYDAFMLAALFPCMYYNEPIVIKGLVSKELYYNLVRYVYSIIQAFRPEMHRIDITVDGFAVAKQIKEKVVGTGFSGGVDSFFTIVQHLISEQEDDYRLNHLFFFNLGQYGNPSKPDTFERAYNRYLFCKKSTDEIGLPYTFMDTNLFAFYRPEWEHLSDELNRAVAVFSIQRVCNIFYMPSAHTYAQHEIFPANHNADLASFAEHMLTPLLCTESCKNVLDGAQFTRIEKLELIRDYIPAQKYLNVCTNISDGYTDGNNCSCCGKCQRTICELDLLGLADQFSSVFDFEMWRKKKYAFLCATLVNSKKDIYGFEIIQLAKSKGIRIPFYLEAQIVYQYNRIISRIMRSFSKK